jgi:hypothetical protein
MASAQKKVIVRLAGGALAWGYLAQAGFISAGPDGDQIELIEVDARAKSILLKEITAIFYVKDFNLDDQTEPERLGRRSFPARPRSEGLWVKVEFNELAPLEGVVSFDLAFIDGLLESKGIFMTPPDGRSNAVKLFIPRSSIRGLEVLGWVSSPTKKLAEKTAKQAALALQAGLFENEE